MGSKYQAYPEYKDSGVEWLGKIPKHWMITRIKFITRCLDGSRIPLNAQERGDMQGDIPYWGANNVVDYVKDFLFDEELVLLGEDGAPFFDKSKEVAFNVSGKIWPNNHVHVLRPNKQKVEFRFLKHAINCADFHLYISGSTRDKLNQSDMNEIYIRCCNLLEQEKIANFLDHETAKIDTLIEKQQQLIKLLKEKRQAVISHAVTKGLNPNAKMRDSRVEWLGEVPEHWIVTQPRYICSFVGGGTPTKENPAFWDGEIPWVSPKDMKSDYISNAQDKITPAAVMQSAAKLIDAGAVLIVVRGMILDHSIPVALSKVVITINQDMKALIPNHEINGEYLLYCLKGMRDNMLDLVESSAHGTKCLRTEQFDRMELPLPPLNEQLNIVSQLKKELERIDKLVLNTISMIELAAERRTALISAAVTGKIDVRDWQAPNG